MGKPLGTVIREKKEKGKDSVREKSVSAHGIRVLIFLRETKPASIPF